MRANHFWWRLGVLRWGEHEPLNEGNRYMIEVERIEDI